VLYLVRFQKKRSPSNISSNIFVLDDNEISLVLIPEVSVDCFSSRYDYIL
jgi:hypothetical protein